MIPRSEAYTRQMPKTLQIFEHQTLRVARGELAEGEFASLARFNEDAHNRYFTIGYRSITAKQYVGVMQIGDLTLEILPKADRSNDVSKWRNALIQMLIACRYLNLETLTETPLRLRTCSLLDLFLLSFLAEVENIIRKGPVKRYVRGIKEVPYLKGRVVFSQQLRTQLTKRHLFVADHERYIIDHLLHRILKTALRIVGDISPTPYIRAKSQSLLLSFEYVSDVRIDEHAFTKVVYDRKTRGYGKAIDLARLIILHYSPEISAGKMPLLAILFDMNRVFEQYIGFQVRRACKRHPGFSIKTQESKRFWAYRRIRPDIVIRYTDGSRKPVILDTKWKIVDTNNPSDEDIRQMYAYNVHFGASRSILVYPACGAASGKPTPFRKSLACEDFEHTCQTYFVELFKENGALDGDVGERMLEVLNR